MNYKILNQAIHPVLFKDISLTLLSKNFYWNYYDYINLAPSNNFKFYTEIFKDDNLASPQLKGFMPIVKPLTEIVGAKSICSVAAQLLTKTDKQEEFIFNQFEPNSKVGILFINKHDGGIKLNNEFIETNPNKLILFNSNDELKLITQTNNKIGLSLIINYI